MKSQPRRIPNNPRRGWTLIQMLVVIGVMGVLTTVAINLVVATMHTEAHVAKSWINERQLERFTNDWRSDAHAARFVKVSRQKERQSAIFQSEETSARSIRYVAELNQVVRQELDGDKVTRTESYRFADWEFVFGPLESQELEVTLKTGDQLQATCHRTYSPKLRSTVSQPYRDDRIVTVIGRNHRFEKSLEAKHDQDAK